MVMENRLTHWVEKHLILYSPGGGHMSAGVRLKRARTHSTTDNLQTHHKYLQTILFTTVNDPQHPSYLFVFIPK